MGFRILRVVRHVEQPQVAPVTGYRWNYDLALLQLVHSAGPSWWHGVRVPMVNEVVYNGQRNLTQGHYIHT